MDIYLSIPEAASIAQVSVQVLNDLAVTGRINSVKTSTGDILVSAKDVKERIITSIADTAKYSHLVGNPISIAEASRRYRLQHSTLSRWVSKGYITRIGTNGRQVLIDESDVALYAELYHANEGGQGKWIFDKGGLLYRKKK